jgi:hypothetical protein
MLDRAVHGLALMFGTALGIPASTAAGLNHYAFATIQETTIVLDGQRPVDSKYVDPADDSRNTHVTK